MVRGERQGKRVPALKRHSLSASHSSEMKHIGRWVFMGLGVFADNEHVLYTFMQDPNYRSLNA